MAPRTRIVKIGALILSQFGLLAALNFQLFGMVTAYKMMALKRNGSLAAYLSARKTYLQRKRSNMSKTSASVSSGVVSRCLEPLMKHEARVFFSITPKNTIQ